jgi:PAS domain S-box-containing protein
MKWRLPGWVRIVLAGVIYYLAGLSSVAPSAAAPITKALWLPAGIGVAAFLLCGNRVWPAIAAAGALLSWQVHPNLGFAFGGMICAAGEAFLAAWLLRRVGFRPSLERLRDALFFLLLGTVLAPAVTATVGEAFHSWSGYHPATPYFTAWLSFWRADALGILVIAPILLVWFGVREYHLDRRQWQEAGLLASLTAVTNYVAFLIPSATRISHPGLAIVPIYWAALRFGQPGATLITAVTMATSIWGALHRTGTFHWNSSQDAAFMDLWYFTFAAGATALTLAATLAEKTKSEQTRLRLANTLENTSDFVGMADRLGRAIFVNRAGRAMLGMGENEDLSPWRVRDFHPPASAAHIENEAVPAAIRDGVWKGESILLRRDGEAIPVSQVILAHKDEDGGVEFLSTVMRDISGRQRMENALRSIGMAVSQGAGEEFFRSLVQRLAEALGVSYAFVGELHPDLPGKIRTLAFASHGALAPNLEYGLEGSPCGMVVGRKTCVYPSGVQQMFPEDPGLVKLGVQCYVGVPLFGSNNQPLGLAVVMDEHPLQDPEIAQSLLQICSARAATEIERLRVEKALRLSEEKFALAFHQSPDGITISTLAEGRCLEVNESFLREYGATREEVIGRTAHELNLWVEPADRQRYVELFAGGRKLDGVEMQFRRRSGEVFTALTSAEGIRLGGVPCLLGTFRDISERKRAEEAVRESEERYRDLFENANDIIVTTDTSGRFTSVNRKAEESSGYTRTEMLHQTLFDMMPKEQVAAAHKMFAVALTGERPPVVEIEIVTKDGRRRHLEVAARQLARDGHPVGAQIIARDVTERKSLEAQFRQAQKMEAVGRLAAGVAHDFNNLLTVIQGYCDLHLPLLAPQDDVRIALEAIRMAGKRATGLTQQLLAFSRQQVVEERVVDLNTVLEDMKKLLARLIGEDVALEFLPAPGLGRVRVDPGLIGQVLMNLAVNARDAMPDGGRLTIETANVEMDAAFAQAHLQAVPGRYVMLAVTDTGHGMDEGTKARIFDPFFTTKEVDKGTGLGLATVYGIVQQAKGYIWVESEPGRGCCFKVYLPRVEEAAVPAEKEKSEAAARSQGETILLVEDEPALCRLTRRYLEMLGYQVLAAGTPAEAVQIAGPAGPAIHLLLTDLVMPGMNGRDLASALSRVRPEMKVLFMSGYAGNTPLSSGDHPAAFLQKPFSLASLSSKVRAVLAEEPAAAAAL